MTSFEEWFYNNGSKCNNVQDVEAAYAAGAASRDEECLKRYSQGYDDGAAAMRERCAEVAVNTVLPYAGKHFHDLAKRIANAIRTLEV